MANLDFALLGYCQALCPCSSAYLSLGPDDGQAHFRVFIEKSIFCYINGHHKHYILADTIFDYIFHFGLPGTCLEKVQKMHLCGAGSAGAKNVRFEDYSEDLFLEVQNEQCC